ncbi:unnamed protein product, partial [Rotaria socialis]
FELSSIEPPASPYASVIGFDEDYKGEVEEEEEEEDAEASSIESPASSYFDEADSLAKKEEDGTSSSDSIDYAEDNSEESSSTESFASSSCGRARLIPVDLGEGKNLCFPKVQQTEEIANAEHLNHNQDSNQSQNDPVAEPVSTIPTTLSSPELPTDAIDENPTTASSNDHTNETIEDCARFQASISLSESKKRSISSDEIDETYISGDIKRCRPSSP